MHPQESADSPDVMIPKRLLDHAKLGDFTFERPAWSSARPAATGLEVSRDGQTQGSPSETGNAAAPHPRGGAIRAV